MTRWKKFFLMLPYLLLAGIVAYCWTVFLTSIYSPQWQHWPALVLVTLNGILYLFRMKQAIIFTGIVLILATINLLAFFPDISTFSIHFGSVDKLSIQPGSLLLLIVYAIIDGNYLIGLYLDRKEAQVKLKGKE